MAAAKKLLPIVVLFVLAHMVLLAGPVRLFSPTYDEPVHLTAGVVGLKMGDYRFNGYHHPPFGEMWAALPVLFMKPIVPVQHEAWIKQAWTPQDQYRFADVFFAHNRIPGPRMMIAARWMQGVLSCLLGIGVMLLCYSLGGTAAAVLGGLMWAFSPAFLANGAIVSTDLAFAAFFFGFFACLTKFGRRPFDIAAGVCLGLAFGSKYFALTMIPITALLFIVEPRLRRAVPWLLIGGVAVVTLSAVYRFVDLDMFWKGLSALFGRSQAGRSSYFLGQHGTQGWLAYFPYVFLAKTPIPMLIGLAAVVVSAAPKKIKLPACLWLPPLAFFLIACLSKVQIGHRHILAVYPFLFTVIAAGVVALHPRAVWFAVPFAAWLVIGTVLVRPDFIAYFNEAAGGPGKGWTKLTDSNVDWGQSLAMLGDQLSPEDKNRGIFLSYFGVADPHWYGIRYWDVGSEKIVARQDDSALSTGKPDKLAISVTNLQATYYEDKTAFEWLKTYEPIKRIGHSIFLYDFKDHPEAVARLEGLRR